MTHFIAIVCFGFYLISSLIYFVATAKNSSRPVKAAEIFLILGFAAHTLLIVPIWQTASGPLLSQRGEYFFWLAWAIPLVYLFYRKRLNSPLVGAFLAPCILLFLASSSYLIHFGPGAADERVSRSLLIMHVIPALFAELSLVIVFVASAAYVIQERRIRKKQSSSVAWHGPSLGALDLISRRFVFVGFLSMSWAVLSGATWAISRRYSMLGGDIYQWVAILSWVVLACVLYLRIHLHWPAPKISRLTFLLTGVFLLSFVLIALIGGNEVHFGYGV